MVDLGASGEALQEELELVAEDDGVFIAVGVDELDLARGAHERRLHQGDDRRDAAARAEEEEGAIFRAIAQDEAPFRSEDFNRIADLQLVIEPIGDPAIGDALYRDLRPRIELG